MKKNLLNALPFFGSLPHSSQGHVAKDVLFKIMRITAVQVFVMAFTISLSLARGGFSQEVLNRKVTLDLPSTALSDVLKALEDQVGVKFVYSSSALELTEPVTVNASNEKLSSLLDKLLHPLSIEYIVKGKVHIVLKPSRIRIKTRIRKNEESRNEKATLYEITGKVTEASTHEPLPGVNVIVKNTTIGTTTDRDGFYRLSVTEGQNIILIFSFIGYETREIEVGEQTVIDIAMVADVKTLNEVIVVGYGSQKKSDITGSVSSVSSEELEKVVFNTVDQILQGRSAGVQVSSSSGEPGAPTTIRIRGNNSILGDNSPLYVVDGIPITETPSFNPSDIEKIDVLKDASATAIYGSRGANGVILITTKRGRAGTTVLDVNFDTSISSIINTIDVLQGEQYADYRNRANVALGMAEPFPNPEQYAGQGYDWQEEITQMGHRQNMGVTLRGGGDNHRFFVSGNLLMDNGILLGSQYTRGIIRANFDNDLFEDKVNIKVNTNISHTINNRAVSLTNGFPSQLGPVTNAVLAEPLVPNINYSGPTTEGFQFYNPYNEVKDKEDRNFGTNVMFNTEAKWNISDFLSYTINGAVNLRQSMREIFIPSNVGSGIEMNGIATSNNGRAYDYIVNSYLNYDNTFGDLHNLGITLGVEYSEFNNYVFATNVSNFDFELLGLDNVGVATSRNSIGSGRNLSVLKSGFVRTNYSYNNKYLLTATLRADGSSRFATNNKWGHFPSIAVGWRVSEEGFFKNISAVSNLKLRVSYGETGSQALSPYQSLARYHFLVYPMGNAPVTGYAPSSVENPNLKWETTDQSDIGLDLGLFDDKTSLTFDYFTKTTRDLLSNISLPSQTGFSSAVVNFGSIQNKGIEIELNHYIFNSASFSWNTGFNYTSYKTKIIELGGSGEVFGPGFGLSGSGHIYRTGEEFGLFYGLVATGLIQQADLDAAAESGSPLPALNEDRQLGHWKYQDTNGDGVINAEDRQIIGNPNPDFLFGWNNTLSYKRFSLNIFFQGSIGNDIYNNLGTILRSGFLNDQSYKNQSAGWYQNRWTEDNQHNDILYPSMNNVTIPAANFMVEDGSYVRLKNISLGYTFRPGVLKSALLQLFATGTNLLTITNYSGFDPEVSSLGSNTLAPGVDLGVYPISKSFTLGLRASF